MSSTPPEGKTAEAHISVPVRECFQKAVKNKGIERSLKMAIPKEVYEALEKEIEPIEAE